MWSLFGATWAIINSSPPQLYSLLHIWSKNSEVKMLKYSIVAILELAKHSNVSV